MAFINYLFVTIPESMIVVLWGAILIGYRFHEVKTKILLGGILLATLSDVMWLFDFLPDLRVLITYSLSILLYKFLLKESWLRSIVMFLGTFLSLIISEIIVVLMVSPFVNIETIVNTPYLKALITYLYLIPIIVGIILFQKKNWSFNTIFKRKKNNANRSNIYWMFIIVSAIGQILLIVYLNYAFYIEKTSGAERRILFEISGIPLISLLLLIFDVVLIYHIIKYKNYQHNLELNQFEDSYQENMQGLIHTLKSERHDYINDIQVLYGMSQEKMYDHLQEYLQHLVVNITKVNRVISLKNIPVSAFLHSKFNELESNNIELKIQVNTQDTFSSIKGYDIVKIISNIVDNAIRAITEAKIEKPYIELQWDKQDNKAIITIINNGPKIDKNKLDLLFQEGFSTKKKNTNSGYGLAIVKKSVDKYHGKIKVSSSKEKTSFTIIIPL